MEISVKERKVSHSTSVGKRRKSSSQNWVINKSNGSLLDGIKNAKCRRRCRSPDVRAIFQTRSYLGYVESQPSLLSSHEDTFGNTAPNQLKQSTGRGASWDFARVFNNTKRTVLDIAIQLKKYLPIIVPTIFGVIEKVNKCSWAIAIQFN